MSIVNGTTYDDRTQMCVIWVLERARVEGYRIRFHYGVPDGRDWLEDSDVEGYIGRSSGTVKIPILLKNPRSTGDGGILDHCIVKITRRLGRKRVLLWQAPNYQRPRLGTSSTPLDAPGDTRIVFPWQVQRLAPDSEVVARFRTLTAARRWMHRMEDIT